MRFIRVIAPAVSKALRIEADQTNFSSDRIRVSWSAIRLVSDLITAKSCRICTSMADWVGRGSDILDAFELEATAATFGNWDRCIHRVGDAFVWAVFSVACKSHYAISNITSISSVLLIAQVNGTVAVMAANWTYEPEALKHLAKNVVVFWICAAPKYAPAALCCMSTIPSNQPVVLTIV